MFPVAACPISRHFKNHKKGERKKGREKGRVFVSTPNQIPIRTGDRKGAEFTPPKKRRKKCSKGTFPMALARNSIECSNCLVYSKEVSKVTDDKKSSNSIPADGFATVLLLPSPFTAQI